MNPVDPQVDQMVRELSAKTNAFRQSIVILTANRSGLFTKLGSKSLSAPQIAAEMGWDPRAAEVFLNALTAVGLLTKADGRFSNTEISRRLLVQGSPDYQGDILNHNLYLWERWSRIAEVLETGRSLRGPEKRRTDDELRAFICGMANTARFSAAKLWDRLDLSDRKKLLDVGGGPGIYSFAACRCFPGLEAVVFDLPEVEPIFDEHRRQSGMEDRVRFHPGDYNADPLPGGCDVALLSSIIHSLGEDQNRALLGKVAAALSPGGRVIVKDFFISEDGTKPLYAALFAVNMLLGTEAGGCYSRPAVERWLQEAGFQPEDYFDLTEQAGVLVGEKMT